METTAKEVFIKQQYIPLLDNLHAETRGKWGRMNAQQMVEHVTGFFKVSSNQQHYPLVTPEEQLPKFKAFLLSDKEFRENTKAPTSIIGEEPLPVHHATMQAAIVELKSAIDDFFTYFAKDPSQTTLHPTFGYLNFEEWILLHYKHVVHHARQFGLI